MLIGREHLDIIHFDLRLRKFFKHDPEAIKKTAIGLTPAKVKEAAEEMYSIGWIGEGKGYLSSEKFEKLKVVVSSQDINFRKLAIDQKQIQPFHYTITPELAVDAAMYLGKEIVLKLLADGFKSLSKISISSPSWSTISTPF